MDKTTQDFAWACLPREFREEVKVAYKRLTSANYLKDSFGRGMRAQLECLFDKHNLTSDAEGEEMLTVSAITVREMYAANERIKTDAPDKELGRTSDHINHVLRCLFGSKCLPDEAPLSQNPAANCDTESHISTDCDKPSEPKFYIGQCVRCLNDGETYIVLAKVGKHHYSLQGVEHDVHEDYLELYTEPTFTDDCQSQSKSRNLSQETANCDKQFDNILKDSFAKERRLKIAAMMAQGIIANSDEVYRAETCSKAQETPKAVAEYALALTDALIAECEAKH